MPIAETGLPSGGSGYFLRLTVDVASQNVSRNETTYLYSLIIFKGSGSGKYISGECGWSVRTPYENPINFGSIGGYDFRNYSALTLVSSQITIVGSATREWGGVFADNASYGELGNGIISGFYVTPPTIPLPLSNLTVARVSDSQQTLSWTRNSTNSGVVVQRRADGGAWQEIGRPSGNVASFTDTTTTADHKYEYRVAALAAAGQAAFSNVASVFTSPAAPTGVSATRSGMDIVVTASGVPQHATAYDVEDSGTIVATGVQLPWTHVGPSAASPHTYKVRGTIGALLGAWSAVSNTVQLITKPNPPVNLSPNGGVAASDSPVRLSFTHNPVDSSAQTAYELRHRVPSGAWTTLSGTTASYRDVTLPVGDREWQVRTKGAHADFSDWSAIATVSVINRPGVAVTQPGSGWDASILTVEWSYLQAQGRPQSAWELELLDAQNQVVEARNGSGATAEFTFTTRLTEGSWTVRARAATGTVWSGWASQMLTVAFDPPATPVVSGVWDETVGGVSMQVGTGDPAVPVVPVKNLFTNPDFVGDGTWAEVRRNLLTNPGPASIAAWPTLGAGVTHSYASGEITVTTPGAVGGEGVVSNTNSQPVGIFSGGVWVNAPAGTLMYVGLRPGNVVPDEKRTNFVATGSWQFVKVENAVSSAVGYHGLHIRTNAVVAVSFKIRQAIVSLGATLEGYFDGSTMDASMPQPEDFRVRWLGAENASESVMEIERVRGLTGLRCIAGVSTHAGKPAIRQIPTEVSSANHTAITFPVPVGARSVGTWMATLHNDDAAFVGSGFRISAQTPNQYTEHTPTSGTHHHLLNFSGLVSNFIVGLFGGLAARGSGDVWWTDIGLFAVEYDGPAFSGSDGVVIIDGVEHRTSWEGEPNNSPSIAGPMPVTLKLTLERSVDGIVWEPMLALDDPDVMNLMDWESLSRGETQYRVTAYTVEGATSERIIVVDAESTAVWLSGGAGFSVTGRLPFNPKPEITPGRARARKRYAGRALPVAYSGEAISRVVRVSGMASDHALSGEESANVEKLTELAQISDPVFMFRDPDGRRIYGQIDDIPMPRDTVAPHESGWNGLWGYQFALEETGRT